VVKKVRILKGLPKDRVIAIGASSTSRRMNSLRNTETEKSSKMAKICQVKKIIAKLMMEATLAQARGTKKRLRVRAAPVEGSGHLRLLLRRARHPAQRTQSAPTPAQAKAMTTQNKKPKHSLKTSITRTTPATRS
jgi:hypothetical protein